MPVAAREETMSNGDQGSTSPPKWLQLLALVLGGGLAGLVTAVSAWWIEGQKIEHQAEEANLSFVNRYLEWVMNKDIDTRIRIAEYLEHIIEDDQHKKRWATYLASIETKRNQWKAPYVAILSKKAGGKPLSIEEVVLLNEMEKYFGAADFQIPTPKPASQPGAVQPAQEQQPTASTPQVPVIPSSEAGRLLASCAKKEIGVSEDADTPNRGSKVDEYIRAVGEAPENNVPWSSAFVGWCLEQTGLKQTLPPAPTARALWESAQERGLAVATRDVAQTTAQGPGQGVIDLQIGDIYVITTTLGDAGSAFVGIVTELPDATTFWGIEGDTKIKDIASNVPGGPPDGVFEKRWPRHQIDVGIIRLGAPPPVQSTVAP